VSCENASVTPPGDRLNARPLGRAGGAARISGAVKSPAGHRTIAAVLAGFTPPRPGRVRTIPARVVGRLWARSGGLPAGFTGLSIVDDLTAAIAARGGPDDVVAYATGGRVYLDTRVLAYTRRGLFSPTELQALIRHELEHLAAPTPTNTPSPPAPHPRTCGCSPGRSLDWCPGRCRGWGRWR